MKIQDSIKKSNIYITYNTWKWREKTVHNGSKYEDKVFYVIRRHANRAGLFSFVCTNLGSIKEARSKGYIPVIDMQNSKNPMLQDNQVGKANAWELFFEQPCGFGLNDINKARNVILGGINPPNSFPEYAMLSKPEEVNEWNRIAKKYIIPKSDLLQKAQDYRVNAINGTKILGVLCRGTDYILSHPKDHPIQPPIDDVIAKCRDWMSRYGYDTIYLATEDKHIYDTFSRAFPGMIYSYQQQRVIADAEQNINDLMNQMNNPLTLYQEYFISILILSICDGLIAGAANGTYGALLLSHGFEHCFVYQLGRYE